MKEDEAKEMGAKEEVINPEENTKSLNQLVTRTSAEFGEALFGAAVKKAKKDFSEEIVSEVQRLIKELENAHLWEERNRECAAIIQRKIDAVRAGQFRVDTNRGKRIIFSDPELNKPYPHEMGFLPQG